MLLPLLVGATALTVRTATGDAEAFFPVHDRRATVVVVALTDCPIAQAYSPELIRIAKAYASRHVRFAMAFVGSDGKAVMRHLKTFGLPYEGLLADRPLLRYLGAVAVPTAAVVGADGTLAYVGRIDDRFPTLGVQRPPRTQDLRDALDAYLAGRTVRPSRTTVVGCALP